jgi:hypothetical protein
MEDMVDLDDFKEIYPWLFRMWTSIERRLDFIVQLLHRAREENVQMVQGTCKSLSAAGLSFHARGAVEPGTQIYLRVQPPCFPVILVEMIGLVQRCEPVPGQESRWAVSVNYAAFNSEDREELIGYIFKRQREMLRRKSTY